jgi:ketosteroid isomerase-like protein
MLQTTKIFAIILFAVLFLSGKNYAQQWSAEQKEVWAGVEKYWEVNQNNPMDFIQYFDDSYLGWNYDSEAPHTKNDVTKYFSYWSKKGKEQFHALTPARIWVNGDFAYVHYYYTQVTESNDGKPKTEKGRWTDILMKKGDKWMLVGDHGGEIKHED